MAAIQSLGIHTPTALPYLIAEGILPAEPSEKDYTWTTYNVESPDGGGEEELVTTDYCVVYSTGDVVRKVFRFEVEEQKIQQAVLTWFHSEDDSFIGGKKRKRKSVDGDQITSRSQHAPSVKGSFTANLSVRQKPGYGVRALDAPGIHKSQRASKEVHVDRARALVVFLKLQAHIYFIEGTSHVVNLPFEVDRAFPAPKGLIIQRRLLPQNAIMSTPMLPSASQKSFLSPEALQTRRRQQRSSQSGSRKSKDRGSHASRASFALDDLLKSFGNPGGEELPRHFAFTDPLSEMGLVVSTRSSLSSSAHVSQSGSLSDAESLTSDEEVLHVSPDYEFTDESGSKGASLILVVTGNHSRKVYSIYSASYVKLRPLASGMDANSGTASGNKTRRRSSCVPGTGATTPAIRTRDQARESVGITAKLPNCQDPSVYQTAEETIASQLDPDFDRSQGPAKESRRVSSHLSRADLSTNHDRSAFQDMAIGHGSGSAIHGRRAPSLGAATSRTKLGGRKSYAKASTAGSILSRASVAGSSDEEPVEAHRLSRLNIAADDEGAASFDGGFAMPPFQQPFDGLHKEFILQKIKEISMDKPGSFSSWANVEHLHQPRIFTISEPRNVKSATRDARRICLHIIQMHTQDRLEIFMNVHKVPTTGGGLGESFTLVPVFERYQRHGNQLDAIKITDGGISRIVTLSRDTTSQPVLSLLTCWSPSIPPLKLKIPALFVYNPLALSESPTSAHRPTTGRRRTSDTPKDLSSLHHSGSASTFDVVDGNGTKHRLQVQLRPQNEYVGAVLETCRLVLPDGLGDIATDCWWEMCRQLPETQKDSEWLALVTMLLSLAAGHVAPPPVQRRGKSRASSRSHRKDRSIISTTSECNGDPILRMWGMLQKQPSPKFWDSSAWSWAFKTDVGALQQWAPAATQSGLITTCIAWARTFLASDIGSALLSPLYNRGDAGRHDIPRLLIALHLLREEQKFDVLHRDRLEGGPWDLAPVLVQLACWLGWTGWAQSCGSYFDLEGAGQAHFEFEEATINGYPYTSPPPTETPPCVFDWLSKMVTSHNYQSMLTLTVLLMGANNLTIEPSPPRALKKLITRLTPRTLSLSEYFKGLSLTNLSSGRVELMSQCGIDKVTLETLPESVLALMQNALVQCQASPPTTWDESLLRLVGRNDLIRLAQLDQDAMKEFPSSTAHVHSLRDIHTICQATEQPEPTNFTPELERHRIAQLIFGEDRRYWEAEKLLNTLRPSVAECVPDAAWSDTEILEAQKAIVQSVMVRTFSLASGQSMFHFDSKRPLITEKFHIHGYSMSCVIKPMNITLSAERVQFTEEKYGWAWFHAGVSAGLGVSKQAEGIDTSWIVFNKPADLSNRHAGLLLGLGLNGHLRSIAKWLSFKYLTVKHTMTSIGLLLGLSVSFLGSMDALVTRLLSVHITRMLPPGAAELNLSPLTQTTGLMGIGMLYYATQHRRMSEIMLSEVEFADVENPTEGADTLRDESYRLAAGFALGFINLGKGKDLRGLHDMRVIERLLSIAVGSRPVDSVRILDRATAGAVVAVALIFMKTGEMSVARKINVPDTLPQFDYVRPDILLLRTMASNIILWDDIRPTRAWITQRLPTAFASLKMISDIKCLKSEHLPFYNILAGLLWSVSLKYAGSGSEETRDFLVHYLDHFIRIAYLPAHRYDAKLTRNTVRNCQDLVALSCATVMAGTGDLVVFRRLRKLHGRINPDVSYGSHMAAHMALGILFLGGGSYTFGTSNIAIASLILSLYPLYPVDVTDNRSHLQAFRHFWVLAAEARCLVVRDVDTKRAITMPFTIIKKPTFLAAAEPEQRQAPTLLPPLFQIAQLITQGTEYWPITLDFASNPTHLAAFRASQTVFVRRRPASASHASIFSATLSALNEAQSAKAGRVMWDWIFKLAVFADFEPSLLRLVLPMPLASSPISTVSAAGADTGPGGLLAGDAGTTVVDDRLELLSVAKRSVRADGLRDLKVVFAWADANAKHGHGRLAWLGRGVVEELQIIIENRGRVMAMHS